MLGLATGAEIQRSDVAVGIYIAQCAARAGGGACAMRARDQLQAAARVVRLRVGASLKERPQGERRRVRRWWTPLWLSLMRSCTLVERPGWGLRKCGVCHTHVVKKSKT